MNKKLWQFGTREVVFAAIGAALYGVLAWATNFLAIPGSGNVSVRPAVAIPMFFGVAFGPIVGFIAGFLGNIISDLLSGYGFWFWWDLGNGIQAMIPGLIFLTIVSYKDFGSIIKAEIMVVIGIIVGMGLASLSEMWVSGTDFPTTVAVNFMPAFITNMIWGLVLVPILMVAYSAIQSRSGR
ncbi:MAG: ECF transporter S component [Anaerolineales bacterium]|jgi:energy-coupling factor transport system substrate-specific component